MSPPNSDVTTWRYSTSGQPEYPAPILIVDDDPIIRSLMCDVLEDQGFEVLEVADGIEACRVCNEIVPSLIVVDAVMPNMDGFALCQILRRQESTRHVPILMATGLDDQRSIENAYDAGATDFIAKPLNWVILHHRIRYMLRGARALEDLRQNQERLREAQQQEREQSARFETALANMSQGLCMFGVDGRLIVANERFRDIFSLPVSAVAPGRSMVDVLNAIPSSHDESAIAGSTPFAQQLALSSRRESAALTLELVDGRVVTITHEPTPDGGFVDTVTDVTQQRLAEARIIHMALHDPLTDLPNRLLFRQQLESALTRTSRGEPCAVFCLDLDQFKGVNDTLGHPVGDALLNAVGDRLRRMVRQTDTVARLGGDEFAIVQSGTNKPEATTMLAERLLCELSEPYEIAGHHLVIGVSIGIAVAPEDGSDPDLLLKSADIALYQAKSDGRHRYCYFEPGMNALMQARRHLELDLRRAIAGNEFELFFQPLMDVRTRSITGFEALLRWHHPERGIVLPGAFVPLAEEIGLIVPIGEWALQTACREAQSWESDLKVAVNISAAQFKSRDLVGTVMRALNVSGLDPRRLELEITETVLIHDSEAALAMLHRLKDLGVSISMDDFGTGYSSLSYLLGFPFDKVKIDQSFVRGLGSRPHCTAIIRAVTGMCESLGITATAEGVETAEQLNLLQEERCSEIQGYLVAHPCPAEDIPALISNLALWRTDLAAQPKGCSQLS